MDEFNKWKDCTEKIQWHNLAKKFRDIAIKNGEELIVFLKKIDELEPSMINKEIFVDKIAVESNRLILNYLVSFRTYVDNVQGYSHHLKKGKEFENNILNYIYDAEEIYAFLYELRNFATHFSMVFDFLTSENNSVILGCSKEHLLEYK